MVSCLLIDRYGFQKRIEMLNPPYELRIPIMVPVTNCGSDKETTCEFCGQKYDIFNVAAHMRKRVFRLCYGIKHDPEIGNYLVYKEIPN